MIIFFYGQDSFRSRAKIKELREKFAREIDSSGHSFASVQGESADMRKLNELIAPASLFAKKRMIVVENIFENKQAELFPWLVEFLGKTEKSSDGNIIVFLETASIDEKKLPKTKKALWELLSKQKFVQDFPPLPASKLASWIRDEAEKRGGKMSVAAASALVGLVGGDMWQISNELDKLVALKHNAISGASIIETSDVEQVVKGKFDDNIFALTDAISQRNKGMAAKLIEDQLNSGAAEQYLFTMIVRQFRILLQIREALDAGLTTRQITGELKLHPFVAQKGITQVRNFSAKYLRVLYEHLAAIDFLSKTGQRDMRTMLDLMIAKM